MRTGSVCVCVCTRNGLLVQCSPVSMQSSAAKPRAAPWFLPPGFRCLLIYERPLVTQLEDDTYGIIATIHAD